ncbi:MAG: CoA pyrophosphatase [Bacteroidota bacterium]
MDFNQFISQIDQLQKLDLGGPYSQYKMAPKERKLFLNDDFKNLKPKKAAVLALFYPNIRNETCFLLTLRANYNGVHAAQISLPGGKFEMKDNYLQNTALRETYEEVGVDHSEIEILKEMTQTYIPPSNYLVSPFIGKITSTPNFNINHEVERIIEVKLADLLDERSITSKNLTTSYLKNIDVPCFKLNNYIVWGATAMVLSEIKDLFTSL